MCRWNERAQNVQVYRKNADNIKVYRLHMYSTSTIIVLQYMFHIVRRKSWRLSQVLRLTIVLQHTLTGRRRRVGVHHTVGRKRRHVRLGERTAVFALSAFGWLWICKIRWIWARGRIDASAERLWMIWDGWERMVWSSGRLPLRFTCRHG